VLIVAFRPIFCCIDVSYHTDDGSQKMMSDPGRDGDVLNSSSCRDVTQVPDALRSSKVMQPTGISGIYTKYTDAYGIPVLGKLSISDECDQLK